jgi:hypothetical protein
MLLFGGAELYAAPSEEVIETPPPAHAATATEAGTATKALAVPTGFVHGQGFRIGSEDGNYRLRIGVQAIFKLEPTWISGEGRQASVPIGIMRPRIDGFIYRPWIRYWISAEFNQLPPFLLDAFVELQPYEMFGLRLGQQLTPFSRHEWLGIQEIAFPEWAVVANYYWLGRDKGVMGFGNSDFVQYYAGLFQGSPVRQARTIPGDFHLTGRVTFTPMGRMDNELPFILNETGEVPFRVSFTIEGYYGLLSTDAVTLNPTSGLIVTEGIISRTRKTIFGGDFMVQDGRFTMFAEAFGGRFHPDGIQAYDTWGVWAQADYVLVGRWLDFGVRGNYLEPDTSVAHDRFMTGELMLAWYVDAPYLSFRLRYAVGHQENPGGFANGALVSPEGATTAFPVGTSHLVTLQATFYL